VVASANKLADYDLELRQIDQDIAGLRQSLAKVPGDLEKTTRLLYRLYHRASLSGNLAGFNAVESAIDGAIAEFGAQEDLCLLKANLDFKLHRLARVKRDLTMAPSLPGRFEGQALLADLDFQEGRYQEARRAYEGLIQDNRTWDNLARLAYFQSKMGDPAGADQLYLEAEDELTAKEMRSYAWVELQRGVLDLTHGRHAEAVAHYQRAGAAYSGYWHTDEHIAELLAVQGKFDEAAALYESILERVHKPELQQTLGELYVFMGQPERAEPWYDRALAAYLESAQRGDVHYYHHLTDFYADIREDGAEAVKWARMDIALRRNFSTQAALAWALYRHGEIAEALDSINHALASRVQDAQLFSWAETIHRGAGRSDDANRYQEMATAINPHHHGFHMHR
jgi:tetratricopeptide (TPR) repeat protein